MSMRRSIVVLVLVVLVLLLIAIAAGGNRARAAPAPAGDGERDGDAELFACARPGKRFAVNLKPDVELKELITWAMGFSCKKFVYASSLAGRSAKITMITPGELSATQAWGLFEVALHGMGLSLVAKGAALEVVETPAAKDEAIAIGRRFPDGGADVVRLLLRPEHVDVADLAAALELVRSKNGVVTALPKLRAVLVTDDADHVARMKPLVVELDRPQAGDSVFAIPLAHVDATSVAATITKLLEAPASAAGAAAAPRVRLIADTRTNALFLAGTASDYARVKALAAAIDVDTGADSGVHLFRLRHARAKEVATALEGLFAGAGSGASAGAARATGDAAGAAPTGPVKITADEASNALLVMASAHDAAALHALIDDLDAPVRQVYIEALVLEIEASNTQQLGVAWHGGKGDKDGSLMLGGFLGDGLSSIVPKEAASSIGLIGGDFGPSLAGSATVLGTTIPIPAFGVVARALAHTSHLDVLAAPHVLALDNKAATLSVGANIPYKSSAASTTAANLPIPAQIARQPVALTLTITPHVSPPAPGEASEDREIALDIKLEDSEIGKEDFGGMGPTWKQRSLETSAVLHDEESLVLGGLVDERVEDTVDKIPLLGDLPLLGALFRTSNKVRQKSNLLVIITPHVLDDSREGRDILARRMRERVEFVRSSSDLERRVWDQHGRPEKERGLLADIDAHVREVERERAEQTAAAAHAGAVKAGPIEPAPEPAPAEPDYRP
jgi:general secretion pathway protein D